MRTHASTAKAILPSFLAFLRALALAPYLFKSRLRLFPLALAPYLFKPRLDVDLARIDELHDHLLCLVELLHDEFCFGSVPTLLIADSCASRTVIPIHRGQHSN